MLFLSTLLTAASLVSAVPTRRAESTLTDVDILQYALTLENLENTFYSEALKKFDAEAFTKAGLPAFARGRFEQIAAHEKQHVALLSSAISATGGAPVKPCNYLFPYEDPESFVALSSLLEGVGVSAYLGAAKFISNKNYLTVAGSILTTEARHQAWVESAVNHAQPWSGPEDTPLRLDEVFTLAASFITSCPSNNTALPLKSFPALTASPANAASGEKVTYAFKAGNATAPFYAAYYYGVAVETVKLDDQKSAAVPSGFLGTYYTVITTAADANITDANIVAGPLISVVNFPSTTHTSS